MILSLRRRRWLRQHRADLLDAGLLLCVIAAIMVGGLCAGLLPIWWRGAP